MIRLNTTRSLDGLYEVIKHFIQIDKLFFRNSAILFVTSFTLYSIYHHYISKEMIADKPALLSKLYIFDQEVESSEISRLKHHEFAETKPISSLANEFQAKKLGSREVNFDKSKIIESINLSSSDDDQLTDELNDIENKKTLPTSNGLDNQQQLISNNTSDELNNSRIVVGSSLASPNVESTLTGRKLINTKNSRTSQTVIQSSGSVNANNSNADQSQFLPVAQQIIEPEYTNNNSGYICPPLEIFPERSRAVARAYQQRHGCPGV